MMRTTRKMKRPWFTLLFGMALLFWAMPAKGDTLDGAGPLFIEGYTGKVSYQPGATLELHASTSAERFSIEIARLGMHSEIVWKEDGIRGVSSPIPEHASSHGCHWPVLWSKTIPDDWSTGYYHLTLKAADSGGSFVQRGRRTAESSCFFVLRALHPGSHSKILLELSTNTYNAYNNWGGYSLYGFNGHANVQGNRVSFLRPPASQFGSWEQPLVEWFETNGIALEFCANLDLEQHPEMLDRYRLVLSVGHDEYWSSLMRDHLEAFIARGGNVAFLSGNTCCWQVRTEDQGSALTCWKQNWTMDPVFRSGDLRLLTTLWSHHLVGRPENQLTGVGFLFGGYHRSHGQFMEGQGAYTVHRPEHWLFEGTNLGRNDLFGGKDTIVGYECDGCEMEVVDGLPIPTHRDGTPKGFEIVASCPAQWHPDDAYFYDRFEHGRIGASVFGTYTRGGTVVTVGSTDWSHGLRGRDPIVERITRNIIDRLAK